MTSTPRARFFRACWECPSPTEGNAGLEKFLAKRGDALHHACLRVDDLDGALAALAAQGVPLLDKSGRPGARGHRVGFLHPKAAGGVLVELLEHSPSKPEGT